VISGCLLAQDVAPPEQVARAIVPDEEPAEAGADAPVRVPPMKHYARLWTDSIFTTRAIAMPAAAGPSFTDNLTLSGTFEDNGKLTAILIDRTTSGIVQAYIGEEQCRRLPHQQNRARPHAGQSPHPVAEGSRDRLGQLQ